MNCACHISGQQGGTATACASQSAHTLKVINPVVQRLPTRVVHGHDRARECSHATVSMSARTIYAYAGKSKSTIAMPTYMLLSLHNFQAAICPKQVRRDLVKDCPPLMIST